MHLDHITHQRKDQRLRFTFTQDRQNHRALGLTAHELDGIIELQPLGRLVINLDNEIARFNPCAGGGRIFDRRHDFDEAVLGTHFDPKAAEFALSPCLQFLECISVEIRGMRIQAGDHTANRFLDELFVFNRFDVIRLDGTEDVRKLT